MPRNWGRELVSALVVLIGVGTLGVLLGFLWYLVAPPLPLRKVDGGMAYIDANPEQQIAQDGWFAMLGLGFGIVLAVLVWVLVRRWRGPIQMFALVIGAIAAGFLAWDVGSEIGLNSYESQVASAPLDAVLEKPIDLYATETSTCLVDRCLVTHGGSLLAPAFGAVIGYSLLAGWSRWPSLRREEHAEESAEQTFDFPSSPQVQGPVDSGWPAPPESR